MLNEKLMHFQGNGSYMMQDIDVMMPRPDYQTLLQHPEWLDGLLLGAIDGGNVEGYLLPFAKLYNPRWCVQEAVFEGIYQEYVWVDIFPVDAIPDNDQELENLLQMHRRNRKHAYWSIQNIDLVTKSTTKRLAKKVVFPFYRRMFPYRDMYMRLHHDASAIDYGSTSRIGVLCWGPNSDVLPAWFTCGDFDALQHASFEGKTLNVIPSWDSFLANAYGDYMQLPPEDERMTHAFEAWPNPSYEDQC